MLQRQVSDDDKGSWGPVLPWLLAFGLTLSLVVVFWLGHQRVTLLTKLDAAKVLARKQSSRIRALERALGQVPSLATQNRTALKQLRAVLDEMLTPRKECELNNSVLQSEVRFLRGAVIACRRKLGNRLPIPPSRGR